MNLFPIHTRFSLHTLTNSLYHRPLWVSIQTQTQNPAHPPTADRSDKRIPALCYLLHHPLLQRKSPLPHRGLFCYEKVLICHRPLWLLRWAGVQRLNSIYFGAARCTRLHIYDAHKASEGQPHRCQIKGRGVLSADRKGEPCIAVAADLDQNLVVLSRVSHNEEIRPWLVYNRVIHKLQSDKATSTQADKTCWSGLSIQVTI